MNAELAVIGKGPQLPALIAGAGEKAAWRFKEPLPCAANGGKKACAKALELLWLARTEFLTQDQRQIEGSSMDQQAFQDVFPGLVSGPVSSPRSHTYERRFAPSVRF